MEQAKSDGKTKFLRAVSCLLTTALIFFFLLAVANFLFGFSFSTLNIDGSSMEHTFSDGDIVVIARNFTLKRGQVVVIDVSDVPEYSVNGEHNIIKRIVAEEGDRIKCEDGVVYLAAGGGEYTALSEPYATSGNYIDFEFTVGEGEIFVMGDNRARNASFDSRSVGPLKAEDVIGVVPEWAVEHKQVIAGWERFRSMLFGK